MKTIEKFARFKTRKYDFIFFAFFNIDVNDS